MKHIVIPFYFRKAVEKFIKHGLAFLGKENVRKYLFCPRTS